MSQGPAYESEDVLDLVVVGGGVMGLFTAYHASAAFDRVVVLERGTVGDPTTASYGRTRSYRKDYLDPLYVRLADDAMTLWSQFERETGTDVLVRCGCMNIASAAVTPDLADTYAQRSTDVMARLGVAPDLLRDDEIAARYPYLRADLAHLDPAAGLVDLAAVTGALTRTLAARKVAVHERVETTAVVPDLDLVRVQTDIGEFTARSVVITAGHGTNDVLAAVPGCDLQVPLTKDRPSEAKYFVPPAGERHRYTADAMPVIAYLDTGVYVHPIVDGVIDAVKVGYYNPPDIPRDRTGVSDIADFVAKVMPGLADASASDVRDVDQCDYDLVADDEFVLGAVPGAPHVYVGVGWRGTGYKFAPWVGRTLFQLALQDGTVYDIARFDPSRFTDPTVAAAADGPTAPEEDAR
ncbi:Glycine/D-amino acid oxidase [Jatrophihabitans endophyticus]|uniref:Glycine/D-amino acid oxidase n=1 Tax=Jatrophihabitans endophyticus TaxID=1206085 RepID=A0A1M5QAZ7_9ACTN|nr:FAD-dependent oxidoreductase [Jatrophihabitans endophyticus]SHH10919.1 Glycine/D-amino acid oxidase [Jatrophihabitans endophyticus]